MNFEAEIKATLNTQDAKDTYDTFKRTIESDAIKVKLDVDFIGNNSNLIKTLQNQFQSVGKNAGQALAKGVQGSAGKVGQNIGKIISSAAEQAISNVSSTGLNKHFTVSSSDSDLFKKEMDNLVSEWTNGKGQVTDIKINTKTIFDSEDRENIERLDSALVTYTNNLGESIKKRIAWRQVGITQNQKGEDVALYGFVEAASTYSKSLDEVSSKTDNFVNKQKQVVSNTKNTLKQISRNALDRNASKGIKNDINRQAIGSQIQKVNQAISNMKNADSTNFHDAQIKVQSEITNLKVLIKELQNAESTATALRAKPIDIVKDETTKKVQGLEADIRKAGVTSQELTQYINEMNNALADPKIDSSGINNVLNTYAKAKAELGKLKKEVGADASLEKAKIKAESLTSEIKKISLDNSGLNNFKTTINGVEVTVNSLVNDLSNVKTAGDVSVISQKWKAFANAAKEAGAIASNSFNDIKRIEEAISTRSYDVKISSISNKLGTYSSSSAQYQTVSNSLKNVETAYKNLKIAKDAYDADTSTSNYEQLISANKELVSSIKLTENELKILSNEQSKVLSPSIIASSKKSFTSYLENNTKAAKAYKEEIALLEQELNSMSTAQDKINFDTKFKNLQNRAIAEGNTGKSFIEEIGKSFQRIAVFANVYGTIQRIPDTLNRMYQEVTKVDTAMTNLYKVTDETTSAYESFQQSASTSAKELGRDISSYIEQTSEWAKLGYNMSQSAELAKTSSIYANVGEVDDKTAVSDLVTVMKAYNMQDSQAMNITDMLNELGELKIAHVS